MIPIASEKWYDAAYFGAKTELPPDHRIEYARTDGGGIIVRIVGPNAHVWGWSPNGKLALDEAIDRALEWFSQVGRQL